MNRIVLLLGILLVGAMLFACTPKAMPAVPEVAMPEPVKPEAKVGWEKEWEDTVAAAKKEGRVTYYTSLGQEGKLALYKPLKDKFGIELDLVSGKGGDIAARALAEKRAGLRIADVFTTGPSTPNLVLKPAGVLAPGLDKSFILPEVKDPKFWYKGEQMWADKERTIFRFLAYESHMAAINTNLVGPGEIKNFQDLLNPEWKGKIIMLDPTITGPGSSAVMLPAYKFGWDIWRQFIKQQEPLILRDDTLMAQWIARGRYAILIGARPEIFMRLKEGGAPVDLITISGVANLSGSTIALVKDAPHPNAAKVLINWLLSREGQKIYSKLSGKQSAREDIKVEGLLGTREPGVDYIMTHHEDFVKIESKLREEAKEIFAPLMK